MVFNSKKKLFILFCLLASHLSFSQTHRFFVYFNIKTDANYPYSLDKPSEFLSSTSIQRRSNQSIFLDDSDLPVHPAFVQAIDELADIDVHFASKWLNGVLIQGDSQAVSHIHSIYFVDSIRLIAKGERLLFSSAPSPDAPSSFKSIEMIHGSTDIQLALMNADLMLKDGWQGEGKIIAVLDNGFTGVNTLSPFQRIWEQRQIIATKNFVENSHNVFQFGAHGTSVFSVIAAHHTRDNYHFEGIAPQAKYILCVTEDNQSENTIEEYNWLLAAEYADSLGVDVINSSLGYKNFDEKKQSYTYSDLDGNTSVSSLAASLAASKGIIVVVSAGNNGNDLNLERRYIGTPADAKGILTVGSSNANYQKSSFSSIGPTVDGRLKPEIAAYGHGTISVDGNRNAIIQNSGTSLSAPLISGFVASIWQKFPKKKSSEIIELVKQSAHQYNMPDNLLGYGVPDYLCLGGSKSTENFEEALSVYPNPVQESIYITSSFRLKEDLYYKLVSMEGNIVKEGLFKRFVLKRGVSIDVSKLPDSIYFLFLQSGRNKQIDKIVIQP